MDGFKQRYGEGPLHLIAHVLGFAIAAYAIVQLLGQRHWINWLAWFLAAALLHDVVLLPAYSALDRALGELAGRPRPARVPGRDPRERRIPIVNHVRAPALISGVLLLIYFPLILGPGDAGYLSATGHHPAGYLRNWLLITLALFAGSGLIYLARLWARRS